MTINTEIRKAGPYVGDSVTTSFPFYFKVFSASDVEVVLTTPPYNVDTILNGNGIDYTVTLNPEQEPHPAARSR